MDIAPEVHSLRVLAVMNGRLPSPQRLLRTTYADKQFRGAVADLLDWVPDLKHEGALCSLIAASLRRLRHDPRREYTENGRRYDLKIGPHAIEAKYHFEGDLRPVLASVECGSPYVYKPKGWNSAPKAIYEELNRASPSLFLWFICVRKENHNDAPPHMPYKCPKLIATFYRGEGVKTLGEATKAAERILDREILPCFKAKGSVGMNRLPTLVGSHSSLISRLYTLG